MGFEPDPEPLPDMVETVGHKPCEICLARPQQLAEAAQPARDLGARARERLDSCRELVLSDDRGFCEIGAFTAGAIQRDQKDHKER